MPRISRVKSSTGIYHIMMRGINRQNIFRDTSDKVKFLKILHNIQSRHCSVSGRSAVSCEIYAYALMGNHFHILINVVDGELGDFVKVLASGYALYFNKKYRRDGHLFKERFKSEPCETDDYLFTLIRYIHQNPIKAGFTRDLLRYKYTSWVEYANPDNAPFKICTTEFVLEKTQLDKLTEMVNEPLTEDARCIDIDTPLVKMTDNAIIRCLNEKFGDNALETVRMFDRKKRVPIIKQLLQQGAGICQLERILGVSKATISRIKNKK